METAELIGLVSLLIAGFAAAGGILFGVSLIVGYARAESRREHDPLGRRFSERFHVVEQRCGAVDRRFNVLDERDRRRLRAMLK